LTGSIEAMTGILEVLDPVACACARTLAYRAARVARALGAGDVWSITLAALFSPLWLPPMEAGSRLRTVAECLADPAGAQALPLAVEKAADLVQPIPRLEEVALIIRYLCKGFDGSGCPETPMRPEDLPLGSRILRALLDLGAVEGRAKDLEVAMGELRLQGRLYDPQVLAAVAGVIIPGDSAARY